MNSDRDAFEDWYCKYHTGLKQSDLAKFRTLSGYSFSDSLKINISWEAWQAAKAQADQKIKLLLCDEHLKKCESPTGIFNSQYPDEEPCLICLAKQYKAQAVPDGFVLVAKKSVEHWYLDEGESLWMDEPDNWLCDMDVGDVQEVEHKEYIVTESNTLYATKVWDGENQDVSSWEFFNSKDDAEKAAEYCKAMIEAQEQIHDH